MIVLNHQENSVEVIFDGRKINKAWTRDLPKLLDTVKALEKCKGITDPELVALAGTFQTTTRWFGGVKEQVVNAASCSHTDYCRACYIVHRILKRRWDRRLTRNPYHKKTPLKHLTDNEKVKLIKMKSAKKTVQDRAEQNVHEVEEA